MYLLAAALAFQSLIGRLQTPNDLHRLVFGLEFQSLIGRLQTWAPNYEAIEVEVFQSLIGRLQTVLDLAETTVIRAMFQSLIGRLQTTALELHEVSELEVSIPHR